MRSRAFFIFIIMFFLTAGVVQAEKQGPGNFYNLSIEELLEVKIKTVSRVEEDLDKAPGTVYVITREMIKRRGYSSLKDALQIIPGFDVFHRDLDYTAAVRGLAANDNEKFTLLINGQEFNQVNEPSILNGPISLENLERIEVVVGPSSIFQQANTLVATVNLITREMDGAEIVTAGGMEREYSVSFMGGEEIGPDQKIFISGTVEKRKGFDAWDDDFSVSPMNGVAGQDVTGDSVNNDHFLIAKGDIGPWTIQALSFSKKYTELRLEGDYPGSDNEAIMQGAQVKREYKVSSDLTTLLEASGVYKSNIREASGNTWLSVKQFDWNAEAGVRYTGYEDHLIQAGFQGVYEDNFDNTFQEPGGEAQDFYDESTYGIGAYLDDSWQLNKKVKLVGGIRVDHNTLVDKNLHPAGRAAVIYQPEKEWITKLIFNHTVRMPSPLAALNEIWGKDKEDAPVWASGSPNAEEAEKLSTIEWGNIYYFESFRAGLNLYYQRLHDFITWGSPHSNVGDYDGWGAELSLNSDITDSFSVWGNFAWVDSEFETSPSFDEASNTADAHQAVNDQDRLIGAPQLTSTVGFDSEVMTDIFYSMQLRYFSEQPAEVTEDGGETFKFDKVTNQVYVDASILFSNLLMEGLDFRVSGKNIFDNREEVGGPWLRGQYQPRGATVEGAVYFSF